MPDYSIIKYKLIGLYSRNNGENERIRDLWGKCFRRQEAFLMELDPDKSAKENAREICEALERCSDVPVRPGDSCILVSFSDISGTASESYLKMISEISGRIKDAAGIAIDLHIQMLWLGRVAFADKKSLRERVECLGKCNIARSEVSQKMCLVAPGKLSTGSGNAWDAVFAMLEVLRRSGSTIDVIPAPPNGIGNDDVLFLRYVDYDENHYLKLKQEEEHLTLQLQNDEGKLGITLYNGLQDLKKAIEDGMPVDGTLQPIHPDMIIERALARKSAVKGKNDTFNLARRRTLEAVYATETRMSAIADSIYDEVIALSPMEYYQKLIAESGTGVKEEANREKMKALLEEYREEERFSSDLHLAYKINKEDYASEIKTYLESARIRIAAKQKNKLIDSLLQTYEGISDSEFEEKKQKIINRLNEVRTSLQYLPTGEDVVNIVSDPSGRGTYYAFEPQLPGGGNTRKFILCAGLERAERVRLLVPTSTVLCEIDLDYNNYLLMKKSPFIGIQILCFDMDMERLVDLIGKDIDEEVQ